MSMGAVMFVHLIYRSIKGSMCFSQVQSVSVNVEELSEMLVVI